MFKREFTLLKNVRKEYVKNPKRCTGKRNRLGEKVWTEEGRERELSDQDLEELQRLSGE